MATIEERVNEAVEIISAIGIPTEAMTPRRKRRVAMALMAVAGLPPEKPWGDAMSWDESNPHAPTTREIIRFWNEHFRETVSSGSYDNVRRRDLIYLVEAGVVTKSAGQPDANTNNPTRGYAIAVEAKSLLTLYGTPGWGSAVDEFKAKAGVLRERMHRTRSQLKIPVRLTNDQEIQLTPGPHNELQRDIIMEFLPRFVPGAEVLYVGDSTNRSLLVEEERLRQLGFFELAHDALPDVVAYDQERNWLVLAEAVHSANPISQLRHLMLERMTEHCTAPRIYVSVFKDRRSLRDWLAEISWETEVWLADSPDHLIHFNGDKFLGPHSVGNVDEAR